jgi:hypothetical protein
MLDRGVDVVNEDVNEDVDVEAAPSSVNSRRSR